MNSLEHEVCDALDLASQDRGLQPDNILLAAGLIQRGWKLQRDVRRFTDGANALHRGFMLNQAQDFAADVTREIAAETAVGLADQMAEEAVEEADQLVA